MPKVASISPSSARAPIRPISFAPALIEQTKAADGSIVLRSKMPLEPFEPNLVKVFRAAVEIAPSRIFIAERSGNDWRKITYEQARVLIDAIAAALIERGLSADRPIMILSGNAIDHALLVLAGCTAGVPVAPSQTAIPEKAAADLPSACDGY